jgi:potassium-transporting ATPase KdpC subunit
MNRILRPALVLLLAFTVITGVAYPLLVTGIAQVAFPLQASGSAVFSNGKAVGSALVGQNFSDPKHFWGRLSATTPMPYNGGSSSGSNLGPLNPALLEAIKARVDALHAADPGNAALVPVDLVTASASGLDPDISVAAARYQVTRVAKLRQLPTDQVAALVEQHAEAPLWGFLGEPRVNVLRLNLALDELR